MWKVERLESRTLFAGYSASTVAELINAITAANNSSQPDTITLAAGATFSLTAVNHTTATNGATGLPIIAPESGGLTIQGNGATIERSSAAQTPAFRIFDVAAGAALALKTLTVQGGLATGVLVTSVSPFTATPAQGGGILNRGALTLDGVIVQNNTAQGSHGTEPWVMVPAGDAAGGGVFSSGALTVMASTIRNNTALGGGGAGGGFAGIDVFRWSAGDGGNAVGGGVCVAGGSALFTASAISGNTARGGNGGSADGNSNTVGKGGNGLGGGVYAGGGNVTMRNVTVTTNNAVRGAGGIGRTKKNGSRVDGEPGKGKGGGLYIDAAAAAGVDAFTKNHVKQNTASNASNNIFGSYVTIN